MKRLKKRATKLVISLKKLPYEERLSRLNLFTLKYRRLRGDMIETYKIVTNKCGSQLSPTLHFNNRTRTSGNQYKLANQSFHYDARKYLFTPRVVNIWNSLPNYVLDVHSVDLFKSRLDKFLDLQPVKFYYKACLTGTGDRSENVIETE